MTAELSKYVLRRSLASVFLQGLALSFPKPAQHHPWVCRRPTPQRNGLLGVLVKTQEIIKPNIMNIPISGTSGNFWIKHKYRAAAAGTGAILAAISIAAVATGVGYTATPSLPDASQALAFERGTDDAEGTAGGAPASAPVVSVPAVPEHVPGAAAAAVEPDTAPAPAPAPAPVPEPAPPPAESAPDPNLYTVVSGDTVGAIAGRFGVDAYAMLAANGLGPYSVIVPGQVLKLTGPAVAVAPAPAAPSAAIAAAAPAPAPAPAAAIRTIYVAGSGGQAMVDSCIGPIHFTPTDAYAVFITEHDFCGGWARFSGIGIGETVNIPGYGTYTVTARGQVPQGGTTNNVAAVFGGFPRVVLQTCIPGTNQMLVIGLN